MEEKGIERAPGQYPINDPTFTRDRHLLKTSAGGNGRRLTVHRALTLNVLASILEDLRGNSDVETQGDNALCPLLQGVLGADSFRAGTKIDGGRPSFSRGCRQRRKCKKRYRG